MVISNDKVMSRLCYPEIFSKLLIKSIAKTQKIQYYNIYINQVVTSIEECFIFIT